MKNIIFLACLFSSFAQAGFVSSIGYVEKFRSFSSVSTADGGAVAGASWLKLKDVNAIGNCPSVGSLGIIVYIPDNNPTIVSIILAAKASGQQIEVQVNDSQRLHNGCVVDSVSAV